MKEVLDKLDKLNIKYDIIYHDEVYTISDMEKLGLLDKGYVCKNLFLRNDNGKKHYVISTHHDKDIDLKNLREKIESSRLSFASSERLEKHLGLKPGYVSIFGCLNNLDNEVIFVIDKDLEGKTNIGFHPNINTATIFLSFDDVIKFIEDAGNKIMIVNI